MSEYRTIALDLVARMSGIEAAMRLKPAIFSREQVEAVRDFAKEGLRQRGGSVFSQPSTANPQQVADELAASVSRIQSLSIKLRRGRFGRDPLVVAGNCIGSSGSD